MLFALKYDDNYKIKQAKWLSAAVYLLLRPCSIAALTTVTVPTSFWIILYTLISLLLFFSPFLFFIFFFIIFFPPSNFSAFYPHS